MLLHALERGLPLDLVLGGPGRQPGESVAAFGGAASHSRRSLAQIQAGSRRSSGIRLGARALPLEDLFLSRAVPVRLGDVTVPVISPEDLIVTKVLAGRPKDLDDVHGVLCERLTSLDVGIVRETLAILEQALDQSDLQPTFDALLARVRG